MPRWPASDRDHDSDAGSPMRTRVTASRSERGFGSARSGRTRTEHPGEGGFAGLAVFGREHEPVERTDNARLQRGGRLRLLWIDGDVRDDAGLLLDDEVDGHGAGRARVARQHVVVAGLDMRDR